jgi:hypothetical protein
MTEEQAVQQALAKYVRAVDRGDGLWHPCF